MPNYKMVVLSTPVAGREEEYNDWYQNVHLAQVVALDGVKHAQRFRLAQQMGEQETFPYLAVYDIQTDDIQSVVGSFVSRAGTPELLVSDALGPNAYAAIYEEYGEPVREKPDR